MLRAGPFLRAGGGLGRDPRGGSGVAGPAGQRRLLPGGGARRWAAAPAPAPAASLRAPFAEPGEARPRREQTPGAGGGMAGTGSPPAAGARSAPAGPGRARGGAAAQEVTRRGGEPAAAAAWQRGGSERPPRHPARR